MRNMLRLHAQHVTPPCATCYASQNVIIRSHFESLHLVHSDQRNGDVQQSNMEA